KGFVSANLYATIWTIFHKKTSPQFLCCKLAQLFLNISWLLLLVAVAATTDTLLATPAANS
ncbi:hypothetical protein Lpp228_15389, partial [Lacticaseibacillus paracasei subsp. paracasei Lpp228]